MLIRCFGCAVPLFAPIWTQATATAPVSVLESTTSQWVALPTRVLIASSTSFIVAVEMLSTAERVHVSVGSEGRAMMES